MSRFLLSLCFSIPLAASPHVTLSVDPELPAPARYGLTALQHSLEMPAGAGEILVVAGLSGNSGSPAVAALRRLGVDPPQAPEALVIRKTRIQGKPAVVLCGADARGLMYAALDTADRVGWAHGSDPLGEVRDTDEKPYVAERGISIYTMQRAYFESRLHDPEYWKAYFDMLAASRINHFLVIFGYENGGFMAPAYPFFFDVPGFSGVRLVGITKEQQARNTSDFREMIRLAHERGIGVTAGIWDHIYRGGVQGGGIPGASNRVGKEAPGLVSGVTAENLSSYTKAALSRFVEVFPELDGLQFRMHDESGLKPGEMASFWHEVFAMLKERRPKLHVELRAKGLPDSIIADALDQGLNIRVATKYWMEQMGLPFHPTHVNVQDQKNRRHGYADLLRYPQRYTVHWRLWTGGTARVLLWADPEYVRRFARSVHLYNGNSFDVNEMLATKMLGEPHEEAPLPIHRLPYRDYRYEFERYWHFYQVWGRVSYNLDASPEIWQREFERRFGRAAGYELMKAEHSASQILPRIVAASYRYSDFPTTRGWAEMMRGGDLPSFAGEDGSDTEQFLSARAEARRIVDGGSTAMRRPQDTSRWLARISEAVLASVARAEKEAGSARSAEFTTTAADLKILAWLARYHSCRLPGAVSYNLYKLTGDSFFLEDAIAYEKEAIGAWAQMAAAAGDVYTENLAFGVHAQGFSRNWKEELGKLQAGLLRLEKERPNPTPATIQKVPHTRAGDFGSGVAGESRPAVVLMPVRPARPGNPLEVAARANGGSDLTMQLRYRHLTQFEDYRSLPMTLDVTSGLYKGSIPGDFVVPDWDLIYFVEVTDGRGNGAIYPDLEKEAPYVVVPLQR